MKIRITKEMLISTFVFLIGVAFVYFFTSITAYLAIAAVVALLARPIKHQFLKIKIRNWHIPKGLAAALTLISILLVFLTGFILIVPAIASQASDLMSLDYTQISNDLNTHLVKFEMSLREYSLISEDETLSSVIQHHLTSLMADIQINQLASDAISAMGGIFMGVFSVLFFSFFFIRDDKLFQQIILLFIPEQRKESTRKALTKIKEMLGRYFIGLVTEIGAMMILESIGGLIIGVPNAILIGFLGGLLNVIPYIGPLLGGGLAAILVTVSNISLGIDATLPLVYGIIIVFAISNLIDNFLLQPFIYSNSVKAHPLEIYIVIIVGGTLYGPLGMILAIPIYTILRVVAKEYLGELVIVQKMTKSL